MPIGRASVTVDEKGVGRVMAGLADISDRVSRGMVSFGAGQPTVITVELPLASAVARGEIELDEDTAKALEAAGWSGPNTELLRRRDLQEALGGLGTVLREWDDLVRLVQMVVTRHGELLAQHERQGERGDHATSRSVVARWAEGDDEVLTKVAEALGEYAPSEVKWSRVIEEIGELAARMRGLEK